MARRKLETGRGYFIAAAVTLLLTVFVLLTRNPGGHRMIEMAALAAAVIYQALLARYQLPKTWMAHLGLALSFAACAVLFLNRNVVGAAGWSWFGGVVVGALAGAGWRIAQNRSLGYPDVSPGSAL